MFNVGVARGKFAISIDLVLVGALVALISFVCFKAGQASRL